MIKKFLKKIIPKRYHATLNKIYALSLRIGFKHKCCFCFHSFRKFLPTGINQSILKEKRVIGGGYRLNTTCPYCGSTDRQRLVYIFIKKNKLLGPHTKLLHNAPEANIQKFLKKQDIDYFSADLYGGPPPRIKMDIRNINFPSNYFDAIICNHVLEHIIEDKKAMKELYRVLKHDGWAILQVPYSPILTETFEDSSIVTEKERGRVFGQSGHVRIYGKDYVSRLESVGFKVEQKKMDKNTNKEFLLNPDEAIFFCKK